MTDQIAQGDILIEDASIPRKKYPAIKTVPANAVEIQSLDGRVVLAHGEATGHAHVLIGRPGEVRHFRDARVGHLAYALIGAAEVPLKHEEHGPHVIKRGLKRVIRQREFPRKERPRQVAD